MAKENAIIKNLNAVEWLKKKNLSLVMVMRPLLT